MADTISIATILRKTGQLAGLARRPALYVGALLSIPYAVVELTFTDSVLGFAYAALGLVSLYLQLVLTSAVLSCGLPGYKFDPRSPSKGRFPSAFLISIIWLLGVAGGIVLLVIPGFILMGRWSVDIAVLLADDTTAVESLRRSWHMTRRHWKVATLVALISVIAWAPAIALSFQYPDYGPPPVTLALATNILFAASSIFGWLMFTALFVLIRAERSA